eukprot:CAMPEP_0167752476 /NCGR_PEP_ID=MMETSP0110_2-20121227/7161_1 /TAXON_ID=629695 /ORGANISM="Gymnochlora sp., Strain CCMP2014" /LENGTH=290 /DNA_ID=CAMNT_0007638099 /DNA_START=38 /DNA_END=910 /DNA_ORIENTATION=+
MKANRLRGLVRQKLVGHIEKLRVGKRSGRRRKFRKFGMENHDSKPQNAAIKKLFDSPVKLLAVSNSKEEFPRGGVRIPEIAFAGRSNVGKSSLLRSLCLRNIHVPVGNRPGTTRSLDFYEIGHKLRVVDLPGYGFAYAQDELRKQWSDLIEAYLQERRSLKRVMVVVDARHGLKDSDFEFLEKLELYRRRFQIVLTKADMLETEPLALMLDHTREQLQEHRQVHPEIMLCSSHNKGGIKEIRAVLGSVVKFPEVKAEVVNSSSVKLDKEKNTLKAKIKARRDRRRNRHTL